MQTFTRREITILPGVLRMFQNSWKVARRSARISLPPSLSVRPSVRLSFVLALKRPLLITKRANAGAGASSSSLFAAAAAASDAGYITSPGSKITSWP